MQKTIFSFLFLMFSMALSAQWITDNEYAFKINVPGNWTQESKFDGTDKVYDFLDPTQNVFIEVRAFKVDNGASPDMLAQAFEGQFLSTAQRVAFEPYTLNNTAGKFAGYTMTIDGLNVGVGTFYAVKNGIGYIMWSMIETRLYNQYSATGDAVMNTFTVINKSSAAAKPIVIKAPFKLTNMKLGNALTADYNILPQNEATSFESSISEIFVIWDWEAKAAGKAMTIKWYKDGQEMSSASQTYTLPNQPQGYGWASLKKPASGFVAGSYYVQIDFLGKKQRRIDFKINKSTSNQNSGFVISPPGGNSKGNNNSSSNGKGLTPSNSGSSSGSSANSSKFTLDFNAFKLGEQLESGSKTEIISPTKKFYPNTPQVISVFKWKGNGSGHTVSVRWLYYPPGETKNMLIAETDYQVPAQNGGGSNFSLSKPNSGWPLGQYWVEYSIDGGFFEEIRFDVIEGSSSGSSSSTSWGTATGGASTSTSSSSSGGKVQTIVLTSDGRQNCYSFKSGKINGDHNNADIIIEPWCTQDAGVCGNWALTNQSSMSAVTSAPSSGYISDGKGFIDCQTIPANNVAVVKLKDGSYAKMMIQKTIYTNSQSQNPPCKHVTTILVEYPAF